jgi:uncharacterized protein
VATGALKCVVNVGASPLKHRKHAAKDQPPRPRGTRLSFVAATAAALAALIAIVPARAALPGSAEAHASIASRFVAAAKRSDYASVCRLYSRSYLKASRSECVDLYRWGEVLYGPYDYKIVSSRRLSNGHWRVALTHWFDRSPRSSRSPGRRSWRAAGRNGSRATRLAPRRHSSGGWHPARMAEAPSPAIQTFTGRRIDPFEPDPGEIVIDDIAQALGNQCRFGGHCRRFYSVAQHSCLLADLIAADGGGDVEQLWALLHDASEAYLVDLPHPLKHRSDLGSAFKEFENALQAAILTRFGISGDPPLRMKEIDRALLAAEKLALTASGWEWPELEGVVPAAVSIEPWSPERSTREFMRRFDAVEQRAEATGS